MNKKKSLPDKKNSKKSLGIDGENNSSILLNGLPLCLCANDSVTHFSEQNPKFLSKYSGLFTDSANEFIDNSLITVLKDYKDFNCFKELTVIDFVNFLQILLPKEKFFDVITEINLEDNRIILGVDFIWFKNAWRFLAKNKNEQTASWLHTDIKPWSLLFVKSGDNSFIAPLGISKNVLQLQNIHKSFEELAQILRKCFGVFESNFVEDNETTRIKSVFPQLKCSENRKEFLYSTDLAKTLFGNIEETSDLVNALTFSFNNAKWKNYGEKEAFSVLNQFFTPNKTLEPSVKDSLKNLPLFLSINSKFMPLKTNFVLVTEHVLFDGLEDLLKDITFLKYIDENIKNLYVALGSVCVNQNDFYKKYVIPNFDRIDEISKDKHIDLIFNHFFSYFLADDLKYQWIKLLKSVKFVKNGNGERNICSELYDPTNTLFKKILPNEKFPQLKTLDEWTSYENSKWLQFLKENGLINKITEDIFIFLARENEKLEDFKIFNDVSKDLICYLNGMFSNDFYEKIKNIRFISSVKMSKVRESLCPSVNSNCQKICLDGSALHESRDIAWTKMPVLPKYLEKDLTVNLKKKSIKYDPDLVISHILNVLNSSRLSQKNNTQKIIPCDIIKPLFKILKYIYSYLVHLNKPDINLKLKDMSIVLVLKNKYLDVPHKAVLFEERSVPPYLCPVDVSLGQYYNFFKEIGCHSKPSLIMYMHVLKNLKEETNENSLNPNDIKIALIAMRYLSDMLQRDSSLPADSKLYLPTYIFDDKEKNSIYLTLSSNIVAMSDLCYAERLKNFQEPILFSDKNDKMQPGTSEILMKHLPADIQPKHIRDVLSEEIVSEKNPIPIAAGHISEDIKKRLKAPEFLKALERLIKHDSMSKSIATDLNSIFNGVTNILKDFNVIVVSKIETKLRFLPKDTLIDGSNYVYNVFLYKSKLGASLYLTSVLEEHDLPQIYIYLATYLLEYLDLSFKDPTLTLLLFQIFCSPLQSLSKALDKFKIHLDESYHDSSNISFLNHGQLPLPGDKVPVELHSLLSNEYFEFELDDYAALDVGSEDESEFVYVLIKSKPAGRFNNANSVYEVQESPDGMPIKRRSFLLYGFNKNANPAMKKRVHSKSVALLSGAENLDEDLNDLEEDVGDVEEICCLIKKELENLANLSAEDKKKIIRRLYLIWHPDRHVLKNKEKATKIFQYLQKLINTSDEKMSNNFNKWSSQASRDRDHFRDYFKTYFKSEYYNNNNSHQSSHSWVPPSFKKKNPQPGEAKRWLRQAKFDLDCAEKESFFEWKCFKSHQAAEKSLKAAQYLIDFKTITSCSLVDNANGLDTDLQNWANELESLVGSSSKLRYPKEWRFPKIPHENYNSDQADKSLKIARNIYENVQRKIDQHADC